MDFYNTNYWSFQDGKYWLWGSVYPVFVFLLGNMFTPQSCIPVDNIEIFRDCSIVSILILLTIYIIGVLICTFVSYKNYQTEVKCNIKILIGLFAFNAFTLPGLFSLERGNYLIVCYFLLSIYVLFQGRWLQPFILALMVNIKPYLILISFGLRYKSIEKICWMIVFGLFVYLVSWAYMDEPYHYMFITNIYEFSQNAIGSYRENLLFTLSFGAWRKFFGEESLQLLNLSASASVSLYYIFASLHIIAVILSILIFIALYKRVSENVLLLVTVLILLITFESIGGYASILLLPFVAAILFTRDSVYLSSFLLLLFLLPDIPIFPFFESEYINYIDGSVIPRTVGLTLGSYLRPVLCFFALVSIYLVSRRMRIEKIST